VFKRLLKLIIMSLIFSNNALGLEFTKNFNESVNPTQDFQEQNFNFEERLEEARLEAERIVALLAADTTYRAGILYQGNIERTFKSLQNITFTWDRSGKTFGRCDGQTFAYVIKLYSKQHRYNVNICPILLLQPFSILTQVIIHEAAHLGFGASECQATAFEVLSLHYSSFEEVFRTPYWDKCSTEKLNKQFIERLQ
jgi:hypothetical protein